METRKIKLYAIKDTGGEYQCYDKYTYSSSPLKAFLFDTYEEAKEDCLLGDKVVEWSIEEKVVDKEIKK